MQLRDGGSLYADVLNGTHADCHPIDSVNPADPSMIHALIQQSLTKAPNTRAHMRATDPPMLVDPKAPVLAARARSGRDARQKPETRSIARVPLGRIPGNPAWHHAACCSHVHDRRLEAAGHETVATDEAGAGLRRSRPGGLLI